jgi:hypothetical protein
MNGIVLLCAGLLFGQSTSTPPASDQAAAPRPFHEIDREIRALLQRDSRAQTKAERAAAAYEMAYLFVRIQLDPRFAKSSTLAQYQGRLRSRLIRIKQDVQRDIAREKRQGQTLSATLPREATKDGNSETSQQTIPAGATDPAGIARGGRAGPPDWGPALVELIERTIVPEFWDVHGGPGSIYYYYPLHVLVIRATDDVHHRVGGALEGLRAVGR